MNKDKERARALLENQHLAVLCTQGETGPYASLMAYQFCRETDSVCVVTRSGTEKHRNMVRCPRVALLIDDRCQSTGSMGGGIPALTVQGTVAADEQERLLDVREGLAQRFPPLQSLLNDPDSIVLWIELDRFLLLDGPEKTVRGKLGKDDQDV